MAPTSTSTDTIARTLSNSAAAVLGMISLGAHSGYDIRRAAELSLRFFWALSPPQIYAELSRLEDEGLLAGQDENRGRRLRRSYKVTAAGRAALRQWATEGQPAPLELRDVLLLQLFFADAADATSITALLQRMRQRSVDALVTFDEQIAPAAARTVERGFAQPQIVADFGAALHQFIVGWCDGRLSGA